MSSTDDNTPLERQAWVPSDQARFATKPTGFTRFLRVFFLYQLWRFLVINWKMVRVIRKGHGGH
ncbi:MAG: hypothetical protein KDB61_06325 [Planctomycetes bacterium]|nr:hypothetical protein [Planctomycetota bacterium]